MGNGDVVPVGGNLNCGRMCHGAKLAVLIRKVWLEGGNGKIDCEPMEVRGTKSQIVYKKFNFVDGYPRLLNFYKKLNFQG